MKICGFGKFRNELLRGNLYRVWRELERLTDIQVVCDDASTDGTRQFLQARVPKENLILVPPQEQDWRKELIWKQRMMDRVHEIRPDWVFWLDGDEVLDARAKDFRAFCEKALEDRDTIAWRFHYTQLWYNEHWARTDSELDSGSYIKLWKWEPTLAFAKAERTHVHQFPDSYVDRLHKIKEARFELVHLGNVGVNLKWKVIGYANGLGGVARHRDYEKATYRSPYPLPVPFTPRQKAIFEDMNNLRNRPGYVTVAIPAFNRAADLPTALESVLKQTYEKWVCVVVDDGSTDGTEALMKDWVMRDPRIFYVRYPKNQGAVAIAEHYLDMACEFGEYFTRLGSDDYWESTKLESDVAALQKHDGCYGPYRVVRSKDGKDGKEVLGELCNPPETPEEIRRSLLSEKRFKISWANWAVRCDVIRKIKAQHGRYFAEGLLNCEDFLFNSRAVRIADFVWRGRVGDELVINPTERLEEEKIQHDAIWRCAETGCSGNVAQTASEEVITRKIIEQENNAGD